VAKLVVEKWALSAHVCNRATRNLVSALKQTDEAKLDTKEIDGYPVEVNEASAGAPPFLTSEWIPST
jgi:hypothetical protein